MDELTHQLMHCNQGRVSEWVYLYDPDHRSRTRLLLFSLLLKSNKTACVSRFLIGPRKGEKSGRGRDLPRHDRTQRGVLHPAADTCRQRQKKQNQKKNPKGDPWTSQKELAVKLLSMRFKKNGTADKWEGLAKVAREAATGFRSDTLNADAVPQMDLLHTKFTLESQRKRRSDGGKQFKVERVSYQEVVAAAVVSPASSTSISTQLSVHVQRRRPSSKGEKSKFTAAVVAAAAAAGFLRLVSVQCSSCLQSRCSSSFSLSSSSHNQPHPFESHSSCIVCVHRREEF